MNDETVIVTKVQPTKGKGRKKASALEKPIDESQSIQSPNQSVPVVLQPVGADGIGTSLPSHSTHSYSGVPSQPQVPAASIQPVAQVEKKPRKKSAKAIAKEELIEAEKEFKRKQLEQEQDMRRKALEEIQKLEALKAQLLREEIQKQIEQEAAGEIKRTRKTRQVATAEVEKKKATRKVTKTLMPDSVPSVGPSNPNSEYYSQPPVQYTPPQPIVQPPVQAPVPVKKSNALFTMRNGRLYF